MGAGFIGFLRILNKFQDSPTRSCPILPLFLPAHANLQSRSKIMVYATFVFMTNFIPIFPLQIVVFPGEALNLHIFEPRYKQLIKDCHQQKKPFGIPVVLGSKVGEFGSLIYITEIARFYDSGEMDIKTKGTDIFRILEIIEQIPDKLYAGAIVNYLKNEPSGHASIMKTLIEKMQNFHANLQIKKDFHKDDQDLTSYDIAHHSGLSIQQEYEFLQLVNERQRQEYLKRHFEAIHPTHKEIKDLREKIQMNGHFKNITGFDVK